MQIIVNNENMKKSEVKKLYIFCNVSLILAAFISGFSFVAQKLGMMYVEPFTFNVLRCFIGSLSLVPVFFLFKDNINYKRTNLYKGGILAGFILFIAFSINQYCMIYTDAGKAGFITSLYILFVPVIAVFLRHKLNKNVKIGIALTIFGLYCLSVKDFRCVNFWDVMLIVSAFFFALHIIVVSYYSKKTNAILLSIVQFFVAGLFSVVPMFLFETPMLMAIISGWKPILFIGIVVTGIAYTLQIYGHKATKPILATLILSSEAVFAVIGGILILNETLTIKEWFGCFVMFVGIVISQIPAKNLKEVIE